MIIGVPKEIKNHEYRVGLVPSGVQEVVKNGHQVVVESNAGLGVGISNAEYEAAGARIVENADKVFEEAEMIIKVKEPQPEECKKLRFGQILFTFLHLAPDPIQTDLLLKSGATAIAYETITDHEGKLPILTPMSVVAGKLSVQVGSACLQKNNGGKGILLGGVPGVLPANVVVLGGGVVGRAAARMAVGMGADVTILDRSISVLTELDDQYQGRLKTLFSTEESIREALRSADLVVGAVLLPGAAAPKLITKDMLKVMKPGGVLVDVAIDQGGCFETSKPTTHNNPTYVEEGIVHYCVTNMPGGVPQTSTYALTNATLPFVLELANKGYRQALLDNEHLRNGLNVHQGKLTCEVVGTDQGIETHSVLELLQ